MQTTINTSWHLDDIDQQLIDLALMEDLGWPFHDVTTDLLLMKDGNASARVISKHPEPIVIAGLPVVKAIISKIQTAVNATSFAHATPTEILLTCHDGDVMTTGSEILKLQGSPTVLLMAERTILNFLQRLCAVATLTAKYVARVQHTEVNILDTRKTMPGFRHLDKYAVFCGGGSNHRMGLYDAVMIKDTHIDVMGGMLNALQTLPDATVHTLPVIVEVRNKAELDIVLTHGLHKITRVLLDNMPITLLKECVTHCKGKLATEASGSVSLDNVAAIAETGVDFISIGRLTHSAGNVDLSMQSGIQHV